MRNIYKNDSLLPIKIKLSILQKLMLNCTNFVLLPDQKYMDGNQDVLLSYRSKKFYMSTFENNTFKTFLIIALTTLDMLRIYLY